MKLKIPDVICLEDEIKKKSETKDEKRHYTERIQTRTEFFF